MAYKYPDVKNAANEGTSRELRFLHHSAVFSTREEAKAYVASKVDEGVIGTSFGQPLVVRYVDDGGEQVILGLAKGDNGYHFIDSGALEHDIKAIIESIGTGDEGIDVVYDEHKLLSVKEQFRVLNETIQNGDEQTVFDTVNTVAAKIDEILGLIGDASGVTSNIIGGLGFNADGTKPEYQSTEIISNDETLKESVETLDAKLADVQSQVISNKVSSSDNSIIVDTDELGTDVRVNVDSLTITVDENGKVGTAITIKKYDENDNIDGKLLAVYSLVDKDGNKIDGSRDIEIPKDNSFVTAKLGTDEIYVDPITGEIHDPGVEQGKKIDVLFLVYRNNESEYIGVQIPLGDFLIEAEFKDGLEVRGDGEVYVKLDSTSGSDSARFLYMKPGVGGENGSIALSGITDAIAVETERAETEENIIKENVGLGADGRHLESNGHYTSGATTIAEEIAKLDSEAYRHSGETDNIETAVGLDADGNYVVPEGSYINNSTSVKDALEKLDAEAVRNSGETDAIETAVGLDSNGAYVPTEETYTSAATSVKEATELLDRQAQSNQQETDRIEAGVGLAEDGTYERKDGTHYLDSAESVEGEIGNLDVALADVQEQVSANKVYGDKAIKVATEASGTTVSLLVENDKLLTNDDEGLHTTIDLEKVEGAELAALGDNVRDAYKLTGVAGERIGEYIKIYKDSSIYSIAVGDMGDEFKHPYQGDPMVTEYPEESNIQHGTTGIEAIRVIYHRTDGLYAMVLIDVDDFIQIDEFKDGLEVVDGESGHKVVKVKIDAESEAFLTVSINGVKLSGVQDAINIERDRATAEENVIEENVGLNPDGTHIATSGHYTSEATTIAGEIAALDAEAFRHSGETDAVEEAVGLNADGSYEQKVGTNYLDSASSVEGEISNLDEALADVQEQVTANKVYGDKAIVVETEATGTTVGLKLKPDNVLTNDEDGLYATFSITKLTNEEIEELSDAVNVREAYKLIGKEGRDAFGQVIKIYKDSALFSVAIGDMGDEFKHPYQGDPMVTQYPEESNIQHGTTGIEALRLIYGREDGLYQMVLVDLESFVIEAEFKDGLVVNNHEVMVKLDTTAGSDSERFLYMRAIPGENGAIALSGITEAIQVETDRAMAEEDAIEDSVGLDRDGHHIQTNGHYTSAATTVAGEIAALDNEAYRNSGETDAIETAVGLDENGHYVATSGVYSSAATTTKEAIELLDAQAVSNQNETDAIEIAVGLDADGSYIPFSNGRYISGSTSVYEATRMLDEALDAAQHQIDQNTIFGDKAIKVTSGETGTTVSLAMKPDNILTNDDDGLYATLSVAKLTQAEIDTLADGGNVREAYKLVGIDGVTRFGEIIKVYKDVSIYSVALGDMGDTFLQPYQGDSHRTLYPDSIIAGTTGNEALRFVYAVQDGTYQMVLVDIESFLHESEFKDGLVVSNNEVRVKLDVTPGSDSERFLYMRAIPGENGAVAISGITEAIQVETDRAETEEDAIKEAVGLDSDGHHIASSGHYTSGETTVESEIAALDAEAYRHSGETDNIETAVGLDADGNYVPTSGENTSAATSVIEAIELLDSEISSHAGEADTIEEAVGLDGDGHHIQTEGHYTSGATTIAGEIAALDEEAARHSGETDNIESAVGLDSDGNYVATSGENTSAATSVMEAVELLDAKETAIQDELDTTQSGVGLNPDGTHIQTSGHYTSDASTIAEEIAALDEEAYRHSGETDDIEAAVGLDADGNYVPTSGENTSAATSVMEAVELLDAKETAIQSELDTTQSGVGLAEDGSHIQSSGHYTSGASTVEGEIDALDTEAYRHSGETDNIETAVGLDENGNYVATSGMYTNSAESIKEAIELLDTQAESNQNETDRVESAIGLDSDGNHIESDGHYTSGASTVEEEIAALDAEAFRHSGETDAIEEAVGLDENGNYVHTTGVYSSAATSTKEAIELLDAEAARHSGETDAIETAVGLDGDGEYVPYAEGVYTSAATSVLDATSMLDDAVKDIQSQVVGNKIYGDKAIKVDAEETGTTVSLQIDATDGVLTNTDDGLLATLSIKKLTEEEKSALSDASNIRDAYKLVGVDGTTKFGEIIKVFKDSSLYDVSLGDMGDKFANPAGDEYHSYDPIVDAGSTGREALRFIYLIADGRYMMALIDLESFISESEFKDGFKVINNEVYLKIDQTAGSDSAKFLYMKEITGENKSLAISGITEAIAVETNRASGQEDVIEAAVGLAADGTHKQTTGAYTSEATTIAGEIAALDREAARHSGETDSIETAVGLNADGTHKDTTGKYTSSATTIAGEIAALDAEAYRHSGETDSIETAVGLNSDGTYSRTEGKYTRSATSVKGAIELLDAQAESNQDETDTIESALSLNNDGTYKNTTTRYSSGATTMLSAIEAVDREAASLQDELDNTQNGVGLAADGSYLRPSDRYTSASTNVMEAIQLLNNQAVDNQGEVDTIEGGVGLNSDGTHKETTGKYTSTATTIAGEIAALDAEAYRHSGETDSIEAAVGLNADGTHKPAVGNYTATATTIAGEIAALDAEATRHSGETDNVETAVGLASDGTYIRTTTKYTKTKNSVYDAIEALDTQAESNQDETDAIEAGVGLANDGSYIQTSDTYTSGASSVVGAIKLLNNQAVSSQQELDRSQAGVGLADDGSHIRTNGNYTSNATTIAGEIAALDDEAARHSGETDSIETAVGLASNGTYVEPSGRFISGSTSVMGAIKQLDTQAINNQGETDTIESAVGLNANGEHITTNGHFTSSATTIAGEIAGVDEELYNRGNEIDRVETGVGLAADGSYVRTQDKYTSGATSVVQAISMLNDQVDVATQTAVASMEGIDKVRVHSGSPAIDVDFTDTTENGTIVSLAINELDNFLSQDAGLLATIRLVKATGTTQEGVAYTAIRLIGKNEQIVSEIDATDFVKDAFLDSVQIIERNGKNYLVFTWNTVSGKEVTEIEADELVRPYTASSGVSLDLNTNNFSGVVDPNSDPYFTVGGDGFKITGVKTAIDTLTGDVFDLNSEFGAERVRSIAKDGEQDFRLEALEAGQSGTTQDISELEEAVRNIALTVNDKLVDIYTENGGIEIYNADEGSNKYRRLKFKIGSTLDTTESTLPQINYLRIVTEKDSSGRYTENSGLHTTIRPLTTAEIRAITKTDNMQQ